MDIQRLFVLTNHKLFLNKNNDPNQILCLVYILVLLISIGYQFFLENYKPIKINQTQFKIYELLLAEQNKSLQTKISCSTLNRSSKSETSATLCAATRIESFCPGARA